MSDDEHIGVLDGATVLDRAITQEEARVYQTTAILSYLDSDVFDFSETIFVIPDAPIQVKDEEDRLLGFANIRSANEKLVAELRIDYSTPERFAAETREGIRHYPRLVGWMTTHNTPPDGFLNLEGMKQSILEVNITGIVLSVKRPYDTRLLPIGEEVLL